MLSNSPVQWVWGLGFKAAAKLDMHRDPKSDLTSALQTDKPNIRLHVIDKDEKISLRFIQHAGLVPRQEAPQSVVTLASYASSEAGVFPLSSRKERSLQ